MTGETEMSLAVVGRN